MVYNIVVGPIEALVGWIFLFIVNKIPSLGVIGAICGVSVAINILALPLYNIAESIQEKERQINKKLEPRVKRIKKGFKGDEQFMMLSEYYRQNGYHPLYALRGSLSILIEIPFFIAAYKYLSSSEILKESSFWIFSNLGEADRMFSLTLGSLVIPINILPIIMTGINFVSGYIYTKNATKRDKIQLYALGLFFLVLLYNSPSGLVIYWILNNIFSLVKTIVLKFFKHPGRVLHAFISIGLLAFTYKCKDGDREKLLLLLFCTIVFIAFPFIYSLLKRKAFKIKPNTNGMGKSYFALVLCSGLALAFLCGFLLPSSTIATSPEEFSYLGSISNPQSFVWSTLWFYLGLCVFWPLVVYKMFGDKVRKGEALFLFVILVVALLDAFVFKGDYGILDSQFYVEDINKLDSSSLIYKIGPVLGAAGAVALFFLLDYFGRNGILTLLFISITIAEGIIGTAKLSAIKKGFGSYTSLIEANSSILTQKDEVESTYHLSKEGKNVVVIFLDRAIGLFLPSALRDVPQLEEELRGFTYYPNTVSFGGHTTFAYPAMMGGYEYTPEEMNAREGLLKDLHNEASLVAPVLFKNGGYSVTITDPTYPNYSIRADLSQYEGLDGVVVEELYGKYYDIYCREMNINNQAEDNSKLTEREAVNFSFLQILPPVFRYTFEYCCRKVNNTDYTAYLSYFSSLYYFDELTLFDGEGNTFTYIGNDSTHQQVSLDSALLKAATDIDSFSSSYPVDNEITYQQYTTFASSLKAVGKWLDYLRENNCYDNTRIIIVSDHGYTLENDAVTVEQCEFLPLLLVKDFNSNDDLKYDYTFMTNADTILLLTDGLEEIERVNPFTGNELESRKEDGIDVYPTVNKEEFNAQKMLDYTSFTLDKSQGWHVKDDIFTPSGWTPLLEWEEEK